MVSILPVFKDDYFAFTRGRTLGRTEAVTDTGPFWGFTKYTPLDSLKDLFGGTPDTYAKF